MRKTRLGCVVLEGNDVADLALVSQNSEILDAELERVEGEVTDLDAGDIKFEDGKTIGDKFVEVDQSIENITAEDVGAETPAGAQEKANVALSTAKDYTDQEIGGKTIDDSLVPSTDTGLSVKILLSWLAHMIKSITGKANWRTKPTKNLEELNTALTTHVADYTLQIPYAVTTGTANNYAISLPIENLVVGMAVTVKINIASTGASTLNWNGKGAKAIKKADGTNATNLKANGIYTLRYDGTSFQLQGEGGEYGTALASHVLSPNTIGTENGIIAGTMMDRAGNNNALAITRSGTTLRLRAPNGYFDGVDDTVQVTSADWIAANILEGKEMFGLTGALARGKKWATGDAPVEIGGAQGVTINVSGLSFEPSVIIVTGKVPIADYRVFRGVYCSVDYGLTTLSNHMLRIYPDSAFTLSSMNTVTRQGGFSFSAIKQSVAFSLNWVAFE